MNINETPIWKALQQHRQQTADVHMRTQFEQNTQRFAEMHETLYGLLLDYSKNRIDAAALDLLCQLADTAQVAEQAQAMRRGERINISENRAVLHTALRQSADAEPVLVDGENVLPHIHRELDRTLAFAEKLINGSHTGATGERITDLVHIGIGGSDLGPQIATQALHAYRKQVRVHFVANADDANIAKVLTGLKAETTVFSIASKSFGTPETLLNAHAAREWFRDQGLREADIARHFVAITSEVQAARNFGIAADHIFAMFDWVGGRYSVWSAIGLPLMVAIGEKHFREFLRGARAMDEHFFTTPYRRNIPVLLALIGIWYNNFYQAPGYAVVPYSHNLRRLPAYLQQLDMESNGKHCGIDGGSVALDTGPIVFGEEGVNCQHAFFQLLHQGTRLIPSDFIVPMRTAYKVGRQHRFVVANAFAQAEAFMRGKTLAEARAELADLPEAVRDALAPQKVFPGNQPSNSILIDELTPFNLGMLLAMYEHKIFVQGTIWGINPFDQWGVEYGKVLAKAIEPELNRDQTLHHDSSTNGLIDFYRACQQR